MFTFTGNLRVIWTCLKKDIRSALTERVFTIVSIFLPVNFLILMSLFVLALSINVAIYLFFLAGGIGVLAFEPQWLQAIAAYIPLTYGDHALQMAFFYNSTDQLGLDFLVLAISPFSSLTLARLAMRRNIAS